MITIPQLYEHFLLTTGICTDTRQVTENCFYVALKGEKFDGNTIGQPSS